MPRRQSPSIKDPELYDSLREDGMSEQKAARISNAAAKEGRSTVGRRGGKAERLDDMTVPELRSRAKELGLHGYSKKKKAELVSMIREG